MELTVKKTHVKDMLSEILENSVTALHLDDHSKNILDKSETIAFSTVDVDGNPYVVPVWFAIIDYKIWIGSTVISRKTKNVVHSSSIAFCTKGISGSGLSSLYRDDEKVSACKKLLLDRYANFKSFNAVKNLVSKMNCVIEITPEKVQSW